MGAHAEDLGRHHRRPSPAGQRRHPRRHRVPDRRARPALGRHVGHRRARAGIGRATLYKYFADVESILVAWHTRDFAEHRRRLTALSDADDVTLVAVAELVCGLRRQHLHGGAADVVGPLAHTLADARHSHGDAIDGEILDIFAGVLRRLVERGEVRDDLDPDLLARWLLHATHAPLDLDDTAAARLLADSLAPR